MSTTSPNFALVLATSSDTVSVTSHLSNNFASLDTILAVAHTGTGALKANLALQAPVLINPTVSGTINAGTIVASTGRFNTITATGGTLVVGAFSIGTYSFPATASADTTILTLSGGNAKWAASAPNTGANQALDNLVSVAINTNLNTFSAGFVTVNRIVSTSGALTGLTSFQATVGTFVGLVTALGTVTANVVNCTGGAITAGGFAIGTYSYPGTIGASGQVLTVTAGTLAFGTPVLTQTAAYFSAYSTRNAATTGDATIIYEVKDIDSVTQYNTAAGVYTITASGYYSIGCGVLFSGTAASSSDATVMIVVGTTTNFAGRIFIPALTQTLFVQGNILTLATSGDTVSVIWVTGTGVPKVVYKTTKSDGPTFWAYKVPDR